MLNEHRVYRTAFTRRLRHLTAAAAFLAAYALPTSAVRAQDMDVPVAVQVPLIVKVLAFDRQLASRMGDTLVIAVAYQAGNRVSTRVKDEALRALGGETLGTGRGVLRTVVIDLDAEDLARALTDRRVNVLYVAPLRGTDIAAVANAARAAGVTTATGVSHYVSRGLAIGVARRGERPKLLVNLAAARLEGADFSAEFLKLAELVR